MTEHRSKESLIRAELEHGPMLYRDSGDGPPLVFLHGMLTSGTLWRKVIPQLTNYWRCIVPDWPFGSQTLAMKREADLSPQGLADLVADFLDHLALPSVTLIGNDCGGGVCQQVVARHGLRVEGLVLTPCDAFDNYLPKEFRPLPHLARIPGAAFLLTRPLRSRWLLKQLTQGWVTMDPIDPAVLSSWVDPVLGDRHIRRDLVKFVRGLSAVRSEEASAALAKFSKPALIAWPRGDRYFPFAHAERLAALMPKARLEVIEESLTFVPEDQPQRLAELLIAFRRTLNHADLAGALS